VNCSVFPSRKEIALGQAQYPVPPPPPYTSDEYTYIYFHFFRFKFNSFFLLVCSYTNSADHELAQKSRENCQDFMVAILLNQFCLNHGPVYL
jgi:hypothetical protein